MGASLITFAINQFCIVQGVEVKMALLVLGGMEGFFIVPLTALFIAYGS